MRWLPSLLAYTQWPATMVKAASSDRSPHLFGIDRSSWTLHTIGSVIGWMSALSVTAVFQYLQRFGLTYKRGWVHVHPPDPLYNQKCASIARTRDLALQAPGEVGFLYADEHTANLRPRVGRTYEQKGNQLPRRQEPPRCPFAWPEH